MLSEGETGLCGMAGLGRCRRGATALFVASTAAAVGLAAAIKAREGQLEELGESQASTRLTPPRTAVVRRDRRARNLEIASVALSTSRSAGGASQHEDEQHPSEHETERAGWAGEGHEHPVEEPPSIAHILGRNIDRCSRWDATEMITSGGTNCGSPISEPCFDRSRCQSEGGTKIYVFDQEVGWRVCVCCIGGWRSATCPRLYLACESAEHRTAGNPPSHVLPHLIAILAAVCGDQKRGPHRPSTRGK